VAQFRGNIGWWAVTLVEPDLFGGSGKPVEPTAPRTLSDFRPRHLLAGGKGRSSEAAPAAMDPARRAFFRESPVSRENQGTFACRENSRFLGNWKDIGE
jgi:hypothetical protein